MRPGLYVVLMSRRAKETSSSTAAVRRLNQTKNLARVKIPARQHSPCRTALAILAPLLESASERPF